MRLQGVKARPILRRRMADEKLRDESCELRAAGRKSRAARDFNAYCQRGED